MQIKWQFIEEKLRQMGFTSETVAAAAAAYAEERAMESKSNLNADLAGDFSIKGQSRVGAATDIANDGFDGNQERELTAEEKRSIREKMKKLKLDGRLLPDSAMTTYFGKPAFHTYGNGNTRPASGGLVYGQYLKTHNINPHSGDNKPEHAQVFARAMINPKVVVKGISRSPNKRGSTKDLQHGSAIPQIVRKPQPPRTAELKRPLTTKQLDEMQKRLPIAPELYA
jgi:hypothetical protein